MGVDLEIWAKKEDVKNLFENFDDLLYLWTNFNVRWYTFEDMVNLENAENFGNYEHEKGISSKELLKVLAYNKKYHIPNKETFINIISNYDLFFAPDTFAHGGFTENEEKPKELEGRVELFALKFAVEEFLKKNLNKILEEVDKNES